MYRFTLFALGIAVVVTSCASEGEPPELRYTGAMHVTRRLHASSGTNTGTIFGRITIPSQLVPTASVGDCDYYGERLAAGVTLGDLTVTGIAAPIVVKPSSFIDGMLYLATLNDLHQFGADAAIEVVLDDYSGPVTVEATAPATLASVILPPISLSSPSTVTWEPGSADELEVAIEVRGLGTQQTILCRTTDTGGFAISPDVLALIKGTHDQALVTITRRNLGQTRSDPADLVLNLAVESEVFDTVKIEP